MGLWVGLPVGAGMKLVGEGGRGALVDTRQTQEVGVHCGGDGLVVVDAPYGSDMAPEAT